MKKLTVIISLLFAAVFAASGQNLQVSDTLRSAEVFREDILVALGGKIVASDSLVKAMDHYIKKNQTRNVSVYRLRIFFDNKQNARSVSEQVLTEFAEVYPDVPAFRGYVNPYFKVTVGNFRTKSEAMKFLNQIKGQYPSVFLVRESL
ncbi:MAG: SPOR domain-containing protein [Bacteroidales bacterium]|nr:SPOR domain-containing protein [Bacteroidales bacterium]